MNRLNLNIESGFPIIDDTFVFVEDNVKMLSESIIKGIIGTNDKCKLYGCEITVTNSGLSNPLLNVSSGAIFYNGEIYIVPSIQDRPLKTGTTLQDVLDNYNFDLIETVDTILQYNPKITTASHPVFKYRKADIVLVPSEWTVLFPVSTLYLKEMFNVLATDTTYGMVKLANASSTGNEVFTSNTFTDKIVTVTPTDTAEILFDSASSIKTSLKGSERTTDIFLKFECVGTTLYSIIFPVSESCILGQVGRKVRAVQQYLTNTEIAYIEQYSEYELKITRELGYDEGNIFTLEAYKTTLL